MGVADAYGVVRFECGADLAGSTRLRATACAHCRHVTLSRVKLLTRCTRALYSSLHRDGPEIAEGIGIMTSTRTARQHRTDVRTATDARLNARFQASQPGLWWGPTFSKTYVRNFPEYRQDSDRRIAYVEARDLFLNANDIARGER